MQEGGDASSSTARVRCHRYFSHRSRARGAFAERGQVGAAAAIRPKPHHDHLTIKSQGDKLVVDADLEWPASLGLSAISIRGFAGCAAAEAPCAKRYARGSTASANSNSKLKPLAQIGTSLHHQKRPEPRRHLMCRGLLFLPLQ
jgi:hypothetical protein